MVVYKIKNKGGQILSYTHGVLNLEKGNRPRKSVIRRPGQGSPEQTFERSKEISKREENSPSRPEQAEIKRRSPKRDSKKRLGFFGEEKNESKTLWG